MGTERTLAGMLGLGAVAIVVIGIAHLSFAQIIAFTFLAGIGVAGGQLAINALAAALKFVQPGPVGRWVSDASET